MNPPSEVFGHANRWKQYSKRMDHFADIVQKVKADIIAFQEIRYDGTFGNRGDHAQVQVRSSCCLISSMYISTSIYLSIYRVVYVICIDMLLLTCHFMCLILFLPCHVVGSI